MKKITADKITETVRELCMHATTKLEPDVVEALKKAAEAEKSPLGRDVLAQIVTNFEIAEKEDAPMCQDTGISVFFVEVGQGVTIDGSLTDAINEGVRRGYEDGYLRKSVCHPLTRVNTGDNTPAIIHTRIVEGDELKIKFAPKGAGSENMSRLKMFKPSEGLPAVKDFIVEAVTEAGGNPCPPVILGIGIGGNFEMSAIMSKEALYRKLGTDNPDPELDKLEKELLQKINSLGIGPMGFGGVITALAVHIKSTYCHIASLPVAINVQCHAARHKEAVL